MVVDASREGAGSLAAEIAAVLTERGLGGNDVDLRHRLDALRRDRSARAMEAQRMARRWAEMASSPRPPRSPDGAQRNPGAAPPQDETLTPDGGPQGRPSIRATGRVGGAGLSPQAGR